MHLDCFKISLLENTCPEKDNLDCKGKLKPTGQVSQEFCVDFQEIKVQEKVGGGSAGLFHVNLRF